MVKSGVRFDYCFIDALTEVVPWRGERDGVETKKGEDRVGPRLLGDPFALIF